jgi:hypothetical protein
VPARSHPDETAIDGASSSPATPFSCRSDMEDDFGPRAPCNLWSYTLTVYNDNALAVSLNQSSSLMLTDAGGNCYVQKTITSGAVYTNKVSPGVWSVAANRTNWPQIAEQRAIYACNPTQGKQPMYWGR